MPEELFSTTLPSVIHNNEIGDELVRIGREQSYPITKAKLYSKLDKYAGFGPNYMITAERLPPIPGGWKADITSFEPQVRQIMVNVKETKNGSGDVEYKVNDLVLRMIEEYRKDGLVVDTGGGCQEFYGNKVRVMTVSGHPILVDDFEGFVEDMR